MTISPENLGNNAAGRLYAILSAAKVQLVHPNPNAAASAGWLRAAGLPSNENEVESARLAAELITAIAREIPAVLEATKAAGIPEGLIGPQVHHLGNSLHVHLLNAQGSQSAQYITGEALLALGWASVILPNEDVVVEDAAVAELTQKIDELRQALELEGIPPSLRRYADQQLESLNRALRMFRVQGAAPFRSAVRKAVSDAHFDEEEIKAALDTHAESPPVRTLREKLGGALKSAAAVAGEAEKFTKAAIYLGNQAKDGATLLIDAVSKL